MEKTLWTKNYTTIMVATALGALGNVALSFALSFIVFDETGSTLKENGLAVLEEVCPVSARMIVNQVSMQMKTRRIREIIANVRDCLE